ncbi:hypothetical protein AVEN_254207-1, partial [Araneus ventricosus]
LSVCSKTRGNCNRECAVRSPSKSLLAILDGATARDV